MPSTRRRLLAGIGTDGATVLAGCAGQLPGTGSRRVDAVAAPTADRSPTTHSPVDQ